MRNSNTEKQSESVSPILKWPGGKRWLAPLLTKVIEKELSGKYREPFLGGGALYLSLQPQCAVLSDLNPALISFYRTCSHSADAVVAAAQRYSNEELCYYRIRNSKPQTAITKAARFLYLNRTCWGGIYRLNQNGDFNVPFGDSGRKICSRQSILRAATAFAAAQFMCCDFEKSIAQALNGDVVFADPPYTSRGQFNGFIRYNECLFSWFDQQRLSVAAKAARSRGVFVIICGSFHRDVLSLYKNWWVVRTQRHSRVSRQIDSRRPVAECLIFSRKPTCLIDGLTRITDGFVDAVPHHD